MKGRENQRKNHWCFEISWEVANPVGGIHTVLATKAEEMLRKWGDQYLVIGPIVPGQENNPYWRDEPWVDTKELLKDSGANSLHIRPGRWLIRGEPRGFLVDFSSLWAEKDRLLANYWERFGLDSYEAGYDYEEPILFGAACGRVVEAFARTQKNPTGKGVLVHAHEWIAGSALLETRYRMPEAATIFTTHATALGRSMSSRTSLPDRKLDSREAHQLAIESGVRSKHSMECVAARISHVFSTVSDVTAGECESFLGRKPDIVLPNALSENLPDPSLAAPQNRAKTRKYLLELASRITGHAYQTNAEEPLIMITAGRYEYRNKGIDLVLESLAAVTHLIGKQPSGPKSILFAMLPADAIPDAPARDPASQGKLSHDLRRPWEDPILQAMEAHRLFNRSTDPIHVIFVPRYLDGRDAYMPHTYWELLAGADLTLFPSWYEPWGYTPMESVALGIPTISSDLAGFAHWARTFGDPEETGVYVLNRHHTTHSEQVTEFTNLLTTVVTDGPKALERHRRALTRLAQAGTWQHSIKHYENAQDTAFKVAQEQTNANIETSSAVDVLYLSMEFGIKTDLAVYSGGLGILSGDHLKASQDLGLRLWGIGLAYQEGYFTQRISDSLTQEEHPQRHSGFESSGLSLVKDAGGATLLFDVPLPDGRTARSAVWKLEMGQTTLFLLDPNLEFNSDDIRSMSKRLYVGDRDLRWAQEYFLGLGAALFIERMNVRPKVVHLNEGHTALSTFGRVARLMNERFLSFDEAMREIHPATLFTTHTAVPAGHERFEWERVEQGMSHLSHLLRVPAERLKALGVDPQEPESGFSMTALSMHSSARVNSVSRLHGMVSGALLHPLVDLMRIQNQEPTLLYVTNGVHPQTWASPDWQNFFKNKLSSDWDKHLEDPAFWRKLLECHDREIWETHLHAKSALRTYLRKRLSERIQSGTVRSPALNRVLEVLDDEPMVLSFARRFATYKRPELLLDAKRMHALLAIHPNVLFIFAGKAHPSDGGGKERIHRILSFEAMEEFKGRILFFENYNIEVAQHLVAGSDVWMNVPLALREASGTSGMKATINGVLNLSVNDGWVYEAREGESPWVIGYGTETMTTADQDEIHIRELYRLLETEVIPTYFDQDSSGLPENWVRKMKQAMAHSIPRFSAHRMVREYEALYRDPVSTTTLRR